MFEEYLGLDIKRMGYFFGLTIIAVVGVTLIYWAVFGFNRWSGQMQRASDLMMAATGPAPVLTNPVPTVSGQYTCPRDGTVGLPNLTATGVPLCPVDGQTMNFYSAPTGNVNVFAGAAENFR